MLPDAIVVMARVRNPEPNQVPVQLRFFRISAGLQCGATATRLYFAAKDGSLFAPCKL